MKKNLGVLFFLSVMLLSACSTNFDVTGDWKETMVIYGLLDQSQPKQYIKINKAFLGKGNAFEYAQVKDSVQFANSLSVTLQRIKDGSALGSPVVLTRDNSIPKDPGVFYSGSQGNAIYSFASTGANALNPDSQYKLVIRNNETSNEVSAQTVLVSDITNLQSPNPGASVASLISTNDNYRYALSFKSAPNARLYQVVIRLNYRDSTTTGNKNDSIDWTFSEKETATLAGGEDLDFGFKGQDYMKYLGATLHDYNGLICRIPGNLKIIVISAAEDLNTFINVNKPSTSIIQEKPEFTNVTNGLGIFSARLYRIPFNHPLAGATKDTLSGGRFTHCLKFLNGAGVWLGLGSALPCN